MYIYVIIGRTGVFSDDFWLVKAFRNLDVANKYLDDLNIIAYGEDHTHEMNSYIYSENIQKNLKSLDPNAIVTDGYIDYHIDTIPLDSPVEQLNSSIESLN